MRISVFFPSGWRYSGRAYSVSLLAKIRQEIFFYKFLQKKMYKFLASVVEILPKVSTLRKYYDRKYFSLNRSPSAQLMR